MKIQFTQEAGWTAFVFLPEAEDFKVDMLKRQQIAVFVQGGIGDALLLTPLLKRLAFEGHRVYIYAIGHQEVVKAWMDNGLIEDATIAKSSRQLIRRALFRKFGCDAAIINPFSAGKSNFSIAAAIAKNIYTNAPAPFFVQSKLLVQPPILGVHDAVQNKLIWDQRLPLKLELNEMHLNFDDDAPMPDLPTHFIAVQLSAGNNEIRYKNWPLEHWIKWGQDASAKENNLVLLGDKNEVRLAREFCKAVPTATNLAGKTSISQAHQILSKSHLFMGLDGGLMHLAVAAGAPTFTLWGPSDPRLYGYAQFSKRHCVVEQLEDRPKISWQNKNTTTVDPTTNEPGWWMQHLSVDKVLNQFYTFIETL